MTAWVNWNDPGALTEYVMIAPPNRMRAGPTIPIGDFQHRKGARAARLGAFILASCLGVVHAESLSGKVVHIQDGDTLTVLVDKRKVKVRLASIDAPESDQSFGTRSKQSLADLCHGREATVEYKSRDRNGRPLGTVTCAGADVLSEQVRRGMAWVYVQYAPKGSPLYALEREARLARRGLWAEDRPVPPWEWRASKKGK